MVVEAGEAIKQVGTVVRNPLSILDDSGPGNPAPDDASDGEPPPAPESKDP